jgi:hypothetical protein
MNNNVNNVTTSEYATPIKNNIDQHRNKHERRTNLPHSPLFISLVPQLKGKKRSMQLMAAAATRTLKRLTSPQEEPFMPIEERFAAKAKQDDIPTWSLKELQEAVRQHATPTTTDAAAEAMYKEHPLLRDCGVPEEKLLSGNPFIIIQDNTGKYKTEYKEYKPTADGRSTVPHLYYDSLPGSCPFLPPPAVKDDSTPLQVRIR